MNGTEREVYLLVVLLAGVLYFCPFKMRKRHYCTSSEAYQCTKSDHNIRWPWLQNECLLANFTHSRYCVHVWDQSSGCPHAMIGNRHMNVQLPPPPSPKNGIHLWAHYAPTPLPHSVITVSTGGQCANSSNRYEHSSNVITTTPVIGGRQYFTSWMRHYNCQQSRR